MRQAGILAAACHHALDHHLNDLPNDHARAERLEHVLLTLPWVATVMPVVTNIVVLTLAGDRLGAPELNVLDLHEALERLSALDARKGRIVELKFFGGLTMDEIAQTLGVSVATVEREWKFSRAWLHRAVSGAGD